MATWDDKAISGSDLQTTLTSVGSEIKKKNDKINGEYDPANLMLSFDNIEINVTPGT